MKTLMTSLLVATSSLLLVACSEPSSTSTSTETAASGMTLEQAVNDNPTRSANNLTRDAFRNPIETLRFFEVENDMTVVEIWPGGGWYTEILAPYLKDQGTLYAAHFPQSATRD